MAEAVSENAPNVEASDSTIVLRIHQVNFRHYLRCLSVNRV
jgi:hypothetical protein